MMKNRWLNTIGPRLLSGVFPFWSYWVVRYRHFYHEVVHILNMHIEHTNPTYFLGLTLYQLIVFVSTLPYPCIINIGFQEYLSNIHNDNEPLSLQLASKPMMNILAYKYDYGVGILVRGRMQVMLMWVFAIQCRNRVVILGRREHERPSMQPVMVLALWKF